MDSRGGIHVIQHSDLGGLTMLTSLLLPSFLQLESMLSVAAYSGGGTACLPADLALWFTYQSTTSEVKKAAVTLLHFRRKIQLPCLLIKYCSVCLFVHYPLISTGNATVDTV